MTCPGPAAVLARWQTLLAHIQLRPGREGEFEAIAAELYEATHRLENGCRRYEYYRGEREGFYYSLLAFDDFNAFLRHQTSDHHESASPRLGELVSEIRLEWLDPLGTASDLPDTRMQALAADADTLTQRYHEAFAARVQQWWETRRGKRSVMATHRTMCPMNCHPTFCGMRVTIEHGAVVSIAGDPEKP